MPDPTLQPWLCHITTTAAWQAAQAEGVYIASSLAQEGFIHCSYPEQVVATAARFFSDQTGLLLLWIRRSLLTAPLRDELVRDHGRFPHLYGPLNLDAIAQVSTFTADGQGKFTLPQPPAH
ncbi:MAG: DUF952 domain-containing protein [Spirulinaceae cyanobacterium]